MLKGKKNMSKSNVFGTMSHKAFITTEKNIVKWHLIADIRLRKEERKKGRIRKVRN